MLIKLIHLQKLIKCHSAINVVVIGSGMANSRQGQEDVYGSPNLDVDHSTKNHLQGQDV